MSGLQEELTAAAEAVSPQPSTSWNSDTAFRYDLAFPRLSGEMLQRLGGLWTRGDRPERHTSVHVW
jgi:hypothetical protein